jgi:hypothetical protein
MVDSDEQASAVAVAATGSALAAVAQYAVQAHGLGPEVQAAISVLTGAIPAIIQVGYSRRIERRVERAGVGIRAAADSSADPAAIPNTERSQETFASMWVDMMDAIDDAAAAPLGHLAMTYARWDMAPDRFFRSFSRVVRELDERGIPELRTVLAESVRRIDARETTSADAIVVRTSPRDPRGRSLEWKRAGGDNEWGDLAAVSNGLRLLSLMKQHGLASQATSVPAVWGFQPEIALLWHGEAGRALVHLEMSAPSRPSTKQEDPRVYVPESESLGQPPCVVKFADP